jgi:hypothetical protein
MPDTCPICNVDLSIEIKKSSDNEEYLSKIDCPRCGKYKISDKAKRDIIDTFKMDAASIQALAKEDSKNDGSRLFIEVAKKSFGKSMEVPRSIISHAIRRSGEDTTKITPETLVNILKNTSLPLPAEQADNLVLFLGKWQTSPGDTFKVPSSSQAVEIARLCGFVGVMIGKEWDDLRFLITSSKKQGLIDFLSNGVTADRKPVPVAMSLTLAGWQKLEELKRSVLDSKKAFMAMAFPVSAKDRKKQEHKDRDWFFQDTLLPDHLIPAAKDAGYSLSNPLLVDPKAGNIHARMEVEIRMSRFLVAEITDGNNGAYWEAGFAKGLGKPVIYTCRKDRKPHFDVGSDQIIFWDEFAPQDTANQLKAVIRATLFGEAKMNDGE